MFLESKVFKGKLFGGDRWRKTVTDTPKKIGLEENITLPTTGILLLVDCSFANV